MVSMRRALPFTSAVLITTFALVETVAAANVPRSDFDRLARIRAEASDASATTEPELPRDGARDPLIAGLYLYRFLLSSQDAGRCRFDPSCSHFAEEAVVRGGPLRASRPMASDRLQRCNPMAGRYYARTAQGLLIDPVDPYLEPLAPSRCGARLARAIRTPGIRPRARPTARSRPRRYRRSFLEPGRSTRAGRSTA